MEVIEAIEAIVRMLVVTRVIQSIAGPQRETVSSDRSDRHNGCDGRNIRSN